MADFNYLKSVETADKLIRKFGGLMQGKVIRPTVGNGPKSNPGKGTPVVHPCTCVVVDYTITERAQSNVERDSKRMLISPKGLSIVITPTDQVQDIDGNVYNIVPPMNILKPKNIIVLYDLQVRS